MTVGWLPQLTESILSRVAWRIAVGAAGRGSMGQLLVVLPDGERRAFGAAGAEPPAEIHIHDRRALVKLLVDGETGGGEAYVDGLWSSPDPGGVRGRAAAQPRPGGPPRVGAAHPRVAGVVGRLVPAPSAAASDHRAPVAA